MAQRLNRGARPHPLARSLQGLLRDDERALLGALRGLLGFGFGFMGTRLPAKRA